MGGSKHLLTSTVRALCELEHDGCSYPACACHRVVQEYEVQARAVLAATRTVRLLSELKVMCETFEKPNLGGAARANINAAYEAIAQAEGREHETTIS